MPRKSSKTYADKLRDPRWQKLRLEVLSRDNFTCRCCGDSKSELQVNHLVYCDGEPWESNKHELETLCKSCHEKRSYIIKHVVGKIKCLDTASLITVEHALESVMLIGEVGPSDLSVAGLIASCHGLLVKSAKERE